MSFQDRAVGVARSVYRADVALLVGYVDRQAAPIVPAVVDGRAVGEPALYQWLVREGWASGDRDRDRARGLDELRDVPVPIDRFETFARLFAWDRRPVGDGSTVRGADTYLGAAVREFFGNGGRLCYVVRVGATWPAPVTVAQSADVVRQRADRLEALIPGVGGGPTGTPLERATWRGVWTVYGLPEVSFIALPDLPDVVRAAFEEERPLPEPPAGPAEFAECVVPLGTPDDERVRAVPAPVCLDDGYAWWARALRTLAGDIRHSRAAASLRELQVIAAVPRPDDRLHVSDLRRYLADEVGLSRDLDDGGLATGFLQLGYPWLAIEAAHRMPDGVVPPDAIVCGLLAGNALARGCFRSATGSPVRGVIDQRPRLAGVDVNDPSNPATLAGRVSIVGPTPLGVELLSDVTTSLDPTWRLAQAQRAVAAVVRVLRTVGEEHAFAANGEATWSRVRAAVRSLLREFWLAGALRGEREADAFDVRCDRTTMTPDDLDAGRLVVRVELAVAVAIQRITVVLTRTGELVTAERAA